VFSFIGQCYRKNGKVVKEFLVDEEAKEENSFKTQNYHGRFKSSLFSWGLRETTQIFCFRILANFLFLLARRTCSHCIARSSIAHPLLIHNPHDNNNNNNK
jgi:hypothetical protein